MKNIFERFFGRTARLYKKLEKGQLKVDELCFMDDAHKAAFIMYAEAYPETALKDLKTKNESLFLNYALEKNYRLFLNLDESQYTYENVYMFITKTLQTQVKGKSDELIVKKTFDKKLLLINEYKTKEGSQISYFDKQLELPVSLMVNATAYLKILKPIEFLQSIDCDIEEFGPNYVNEKLTYYVKESINKSILEKLSTVDYNYFELINHKEEIKELFLKNFNSFVSEEVLEVSQLDIENIDFTQEISKKLQEIGFANKIKREELSNEIRYEKESLELYEKKVKIHGENPNVEWNLSEAEKDKALDRYMIKNGLPRANTYEALSENQLEKRSGIKSDGRLSKLNNLFPVYNKKPIVLPLIVLGLLFMMFVLALVGEKNYERENFIIADICFVIFIPAIILARKSIKETYPIIRIIGYALCILFFVFCFAGHYKAVEYWNYYGYRYYYYYKDLTYTTAYTTLLSIITNVLYFIFAKKRKNVKRLNEKSLGR